MQIVLNAETGQRGYLISGKESFLDPYRSALEQRKPIVDALRIAYGQEAGYAKALDELDGLIGEHFAALQKSLAQQQTNRAAAAEYVRNGVGQLLMGETRSAADALLQRDSELLVTLQRAARSDLFLIRVINASAAALNVALVLLAAVLISRNISRRAFEAQRLVDERNALEREVAVRTMDLAALSSHLQHVSEQEKSALSRELHDELGSLLIAAKMDTAWLRRHLAAEDPESRVRWERVIAVLDAGVDFKRRIVEQLRPSLLDNMGLFAALRWQLRESCGRAGLRCLERLPARELQLRDEVSIAIFRIGQEAMTNILKHAQASEVELAADIAGPDLELTISDNGVGVGAAWRSQPDSHGLRSMRHRVESLGGSWALGSGPAGRGTRIHVRLPLARILAAETPAATDAAGISASQPPVVQQRSHAAGQEAG